MASDDRLAERHIRRIYSVLIDAHRRFLTGEYGLCEFHNAIDTLTHQISGIIQAMDDTDERRERGKE